MEDCIGSPNERGGGMPESAGNALHAFAAELYPICRSITGDGVRRTLDAISKRIPISVTEVPSGTEVFDWTVPREWNIRDAYIKDSLGQRLVDFQACNLHVLNYSVPVSRTMSLQELKPHLHTIAAQPQWIPYRTSYYAENWGFCLSSDQLSGLENAQYEVCIDSTLEDGYLTYGECFLAGRENNEVLFSCHICHPALANDNLSGIAVATFLAQSLRGRNLRNSYRFLFVPGTIGSITWLARNHEQVKHIDHGLVLTCIGDAGGFHYKKSRRGNAEIDRAVAHVLRHQSEPFEILDFVPYGYDERQYCSPGFNLPVGCLMRSVWGSFPEYHTSADNLSFIRPESLARSLHLCESIVEVLENNTCYVNQNPFCEPQLGRRNLYPATGGKAIEQERLALLWVLNLSDGANSLLDIAERSQLPFSVIRSAAQKLSGGGLLTKRPTPSTGRDHTEGC
jgi:aminopeptidase-like protein